MTGLGGRGTTRPSCCHSVLRATGGVGVGVQGAGEQEGGSLGSAWGKARGHGRLSRCDIWTASYTPKVGA